MAKHDVKLMQIFKRYLNKPGDEVELAGSAVTNGPLIKQKIFVHAQYHDKDAESPSYRIDKAIEWAERNRCVVLERKRRILNDGSEDAELMVDVAAIANAACNAKFKVGDKVKFWVFDKKANGNVKAVRGESVDIDDGHGGVVTFKAKDLEVWNSRARNSETVMLKTKDGGKVRVQEMDEVIYLGKHYVVYDIKGGKISISDQSGMDFTLSPDHPRLFGINSRACNSRNPVVAKALNACARNEIGDFNFNMSGVYQAARKLLAAGAKHLSGYKWSIPEDMEYGLNIIASRVGGGVKRISPDPNKAGFVICEITDPLAQALERKGVSNACAVANAQFKVGDIVGLAIMDGGKRDYVIYEVLPDSYRMCYADDFGVGCERVRKYSKDIIDKHRTMKVPNACGTARNAEDINVELKRDIDRLAGRIKEELKKQAESYAYWIEADCGREINYLLDVASKNKNVQPSIVAELKSLRRRVDEAIAASRRLPR